MALQTCWNYWLAKCVIGGQPVDAGTRVAPGVIFKSYSDTNPGSLELLYENYGTVTYTGNDGILAITTPEDLIVFFQSHVADCHLLNDIDFNDSNEYRFGYSETNRPGSPSGNPIFNGLNHRIKNLILCPANDSSTYRYFANHGVENLIFENLIAYATKSVILFDTSTTSNVKEIKNTQIGSYLFGSSTKFFFGNIVQNTSRMRYTDCTLNLKGSSTEGFYIGSCIFNRCHINVDLMSEDNTLTSELVINNAGNGSMSLQYRPQFTNTYITGSFKFKHHFNNFIKDGIFNSSYICLKIDYPESSLIRNMKGCNNTGTAYSFFTILDLEGNDIEMVDFYDGLTTPVELISYEQATDPDYLLNEKRFPVAKPEDDE